MTSPIKVRSVNSSFLLHKYSLRVWSGNARSPGLLRGLLVSALSCGLVHAVHTAAATVRVTAAGFLLFGDFGDHGFGG